MFDQLIEAFTFVALRQLWQVTIAVGLLLLIARWIGRRSAHWAYALLIVAALKCLCPPVWSLAIGPFCWWGGSTERTAAAADHPTEALDVGSSAPRTADSTPIANNPAIAANADAEALNSTVVDGSQVAEPVTSADAADASGAEVSSAAVPGAISVAVDTRPTNRTAAPDSNAVPWLRILQWSFVSLWAGGSFVLLLSILHKRRRLARLVANGDPITSGAIFELVDELRTDLGLAVKLRVVIIDEPGVPGVFGVRTPTVVLPRVVLDRMNANELRLVLAHELNHLRRQDTVCSTVQLLAIVAWWFHPLVWMMNAHLRRYREHCCDEEVVARLSCRPGEYARCLLNVLSLKQELQPVVGVSALSPFDVTAQRLKNLMRQERTFSSHRSWMCYAASALLAIILLPGAALPKETAIQTATRSVLATFIDDDVDDEPIAHYQSGIFDVEVLPEVMASPGPPELTYQFDLHESPSYRLTVEADEPAGVVTYDATIAWRIDELHDESLMLSRSPTAIVRQQQPHPGTHPFEFPSMMPSVTWHGMHGPVGPPAAPEFPRPSFPRGMSSTPPGWPEGINWTERMESSGPPHQLRQGSMSPVAEPAGFPGSFGPPQPDRFSLNGGAIRLGDPCWLPYGLGDAIDWILAPLPHSLAGGETERKLSWAIEDSARFPGMPMRPNVLDACETATWQVVEQRDDEWVLMRDITRWSPTEGSAERPESPQYELTGTSLITWDVANSRPLGVEFTGEFTRRAGRSTLIVPLTVIVE